jgi:hypothetical protein
MRTFKSILGTRLDSVHLNPNDVIISTPLNIQNTVRLVDDLYTKRIYVSSVFKMYRRWHIEFSIEEFSKAITHEIIK